MAGSNEDSPINLAGWTSRKEFYVKGAKEVIAYYRWRGVLAKHLHYWMRLISLCLAIISPIFVASATGAVPDAEKILGLGSDQIGPIALGISLAIALLEGVRRMIRPDERWANCWLARTEFEDALNDYEDEAERYPIGSPNWIVAHDAFKKRIRTAMTEEGRKFFETVRVGNKEDGTPGNPDKPGQ